jgi:hypothetical protein
LFLFLTFWLVVTHVPPSFPLQKGKEHKKRMTDLTQELTWIRNEDQKADLTGDRKGEL